MIIGIYKITCLSNNRVYIGQSVNIKNRIQCHQSLLRRNVHFNCYLQRSFNKYGEASFQFEIIEECSEQELNSKEIFWIKYYKAESRRKGFNLIEPDNKGKYRHSESTRLKLSKLKTGSKHSKETKRKLSELNKIKFLNGTLQGYKQSAKSRQISVSQFSMDGTFIKKWESATEAALSLNLDRSNILATCDGKYKHCGKFRWGREDFLPPLKTRKNKNLC